MKDREKQITPDVVRGFLSRLEKNVAERVEVKARHSREFAEAGDTHNANRCGWDRHDLMSIKACVSRISHLFDLMEKQRRAPEVKQERPEALVLDMDRRTP